MRILLWLAVPLAITAVAALWAAWYARSGRRATPEVEVVTYRRDGRHGAVPGSGARDRRFAAAVRRPVRTPVVRGRSAPVRGSGVVVRRAGR
ncbi:UNVERIFIED_CONTAM: hypothetical protein LK11_58490 [Mumia flava]|uniref:hypothetical protein n=1 Tax=Mumia flava TaxID=1348852 RepID=UPI0005731DBE|nr:hypothetical protein [Mumia flava]